jgi:hypothetical protein
LHPLYAPWPMVTWGGILPPNERGQAHTVSCCATQYKQLPGRLKFGHKDRKITVLMNVRNVHILERLTIARRCDRGTISGFRRRGDAAEKRGEIVRRTAEQPAQRVGAADQAVARVVAEHRR